MTEALSDAEAQVLAEMFVSGKLKVGGRVMLESGVVTLVSVEQNANGPLLTMRRDPEVGLVEFTAVVR